MRPAKVAVGVFCLMAGALVGCAAAMVLSGTYELKTTMPGESATLTVTDDLVILEIEDNGGSAYVEYEVVARGCKISPH